MFRACSTVCSDGKTDFRALVHIESIHEKTSKMTDVTQTSTVPTEMDVVEEEKPKKVLRKWDQTFFEEIATRDGATSLMDETFHFTRMAILKFRCKCGSEYERPFHSAEQFGMYCHDCHLQARRAKTQKTCMEKYGTTHPLKSKEVLEKVAATNQERYGVSYVGQSRELQEKAKKTVQERYGVTNVFQNEDIKSKMRETWKETYGTAHPQQNADVRKRTAETMVERYGVESTLQSEELLEKHQLTMMARYGVANAAQIPGFHEKAKATWKETLGVEHPMRSGEVQAKSVATSREKYGVDRPSQSAVVQSKIKATNVERRGVAYPMQDSSVWAKAVETCRIKYGVENPAKNPEIYAKVVETMMQKYGVRHPSHSPELLEKAHAAAFARKTYVAPDGKSFECQGYEPWALEELCEEYGSAAVQNGFNIRLPHNNACCVQYNFEGKDRRYYPDIFIPSQSLVIEVKSPYTYEYNPEIMKAKADAVRALGYRYKIWVYDASRSKTVYSD